MSFFHLVEAGAWTEEKGHGYYKLGMRFTRANSFFDPGGNEIPINKLSDSSALFYGEYGLLERLTIIVGAPFYQYLSLAEQIDPSSGFVFFPGDSASGFADFNAGARFSLFKKQSVVSAGVLFGIPSGDDTQENGLVTGDGEFNQLFTLELGHSFYPRPFYTTGYLGINNRTNGYSDEFHYLAEFGYTLNRFTIIGRMRGVQSFENGVDEVLGGAGGLYSNNQRYLVYGTEMVFAVNQSMSISAGVESITHAKNIVSAPAFSFSYGWRH